MGEYDLVTSSHCLAISIISPKTISSVPSSPTSIGIYFPEERMIVLSTTFSTRPDPSEVYSLGQGTVSFFLSRTSGKRSSWEWTGVFSIIFLLSSTILTFRSVDLTGFYLPVFGSFDVPITSLKRELKSFFLSTLKIGFPPIIAFSLISGKSTVLLSKWV